MLHSLRSCEKNCLTQKNDYICNQNDSTMNTATRRKSTSLRIDNKLFAYIETKAKEENRSLNNYIETVLLTSTGFYEPNEVTKNAMQQVREERDTLKCYSDMDELFKDLAE